MSLLYTNLFDDVAARLDRNVNPYVNDLVRGQEDGDLPVTYGPALRDIKGNWRKKFSRPSAAPNTTFSPLLILEIGCHKGKTMREVAGDHPEHNFIGMDITFKRVVMTAQRAKNADLGNVSVMLGSAKQMDLVFEDGELDGIMLFYPDPWSKPKQAGNRLVDQDFCNVLEKKLKSGGFFWFKTDQEPYFENTKSLINSQNFQEQTDPQGICGETYETTFERKFRLASLPTYEQVWVKSPTAT